MYLLTPLIRLYLIARCPPSTVRVSECQQGGRRGETVENGSIDGGDGNSTGNDEAAEAKGSTGNSWRATAHPGTTLLHHPPKASQSEHLRAKREREEEGVAYLSIGLGPAMTGEGQSKQAPFTHTTGKTMLLGQSGS